VTRFAIDAPTAIRLDADLARQVEGFVLTAPFEVLATLRHQP
jgi:hypothetical protein